MIENAKPELPDALRAEVEGLMRRSGEARRSGEGPASLNLMEEAWSIIPEPKTEWNFYPQTIARGVVETIVERESCQALDVWLERMYETHFDTDRQSEYTNLLAGHALVQCGRSEEALTYFQRVYESGGPGFFSGLYRPYLDLLNK